NSHDPGVTILEQLCYAITDLAYRINYPISDLLGAGDADLGLPGPTAILGGDPVTDADLRKLALDVAGVRNAWIEPPSEPELPVYYHAGSGELRLSADPGEAELRPLRLGGLARVLVQTSDRLSGDAALQQVAARLHRSRGLGSDLEVALLGTHDVWVRAAIEVEAIEDPVELLAEIREQIENYLAPPVRFTALADARSQGRSLDQLLDGPVLSRGVTLDQLPALRRTIYSSDLLHAIMDVPAVRAVRSLELSTSASGPRERWALEVPAGHVATLSSSAELTLLRGGLPVRVDPRHVRERLDRRRLLASMQARPGELRELEPPRGRDRKLARYRSIQLQLPAAYGVGAMGLPDSAPVERKAAARQLEAYLLIFDQLLANAFAQLGHAHELLSPAGGVVRTYFAQPVEDPRLRVHELIRLDPEAHRAWLDAAVDDGSDSLERRKRLLAHLLARFAEQLGDHSLITHALRSSDPDAADRALIEDRQAFLRDYPRHSGARGSGYDLYGEALPRSGLEQRIRAKLGLRDDRRSYLVEHVLLRPIPEDARQLGSETDPRVPLLSGVDQPDPWSLQLSFVFEDREVDEQLERLVARTIVEETPAHLRANLRWFGAGDGVDHWAAFAAAWDQFQVQLRRYRVAKLRSDRI